MSRTLEFLRSTFLLEKIHYSNRRYNFFGENGLCELAKLSEVAATIMAIVGITGLRPGRTALRNFSHRYLENVTVEQALHNPVWNVEKK
jgi:1-deoxy-D-xylulose 5-phosphate reductoisomerase